MLDLRCAHVRSVFRLRVPQPSLCPRPRTTLFMLGLEVPVSPYFGTDIWQGRGLDGLWFNTHRLIYLPRLSIAIQGETPLKEIVVDGIHHVFFLIEVCGWCWSSLRTWRIAFRISLHWTIRISEKFHLVHTGIGNGRGR